MNEHRARLTGLGALLPPQIWRELLDQGPHSKPARGRVLMRQGDPGDVVMALVRGRVKISMVNADGLEMPLAFREAGEVLGDIAVLDRGARTATVETATDCELRTIAGPRFLRFVDDRALTPMILRLNRTRLQEAERDRAELAGLPLMQRACRMLDRLARVDEDGTLTVDLGMSQEEFGRMVGASRNAIGGVLTQLRGLGIVDTRPRCVVIQDIAALRRSGQD